MGPPIFIGGNGCRGVARPGLSSSFNGATDFHRWKCGRFDHIGAAHGGFNGATDFHRWKFRVIMPDGCVSGVLQWGHRFSSVEITA